MADVRSSRRTAPSSAATLPTFRPRPTIYQPKNELCAETLDKGALALLAEHAGDPTRLVAVLSAAAAIVLHRYERDGVVTLGALRAKGDLVAFNVELAPTESFARAVDRAWRSVASSPRLPTPEAGAYNPHFRMFLVAGPPSSVMEYGQDVTVGIDPENLQSIWSSANTRAVELGTVSRFLSHIAQVLLEAGRADDEGWEAIGVLPKTEKAQILVYSKAETRAFPACRLTDLLAKAAKEFGEADAVMDGDTTISHRELDRRASHLARHLQEHGLAAGDRTAIALPPSALQIVSCLAVVKSGGTVVPIDMGLPEKRLTAILADCDPKFILDNGTFAARFPEYARRAVQVTRGTETAGTGIADMAFAREERADDHPLYLLYTSGSTGTPKPVEIGHRALMNLIRWQDAQASAKGKRTLYRSSLAFDVSFQEIFATLCFGGTLVVANDEERANIASLAQLIGRRLVNRIFLPPIALEQLATTHDTDFRDLTSLEEVIVAGERLRITPAITRFFRNVRAGLTNQYGPTETHVATAYAFNGPILQWPQRPPIGRPITNMSVYLLDENRELVPIGVTGEIWICGADVALGYGAGITEDDPHFLPCPVPAAEGLPSYRTGDYARWLPNGELDYLGRKDDQVKLRGYRIELADIEANACRLADVKSAVAKLWVEDERSHLALYILPADGASPSSAEVRQELLRWLPSHMVPATNAIVTVAQLPLTATGKIDRHRLPRIEHGMAPNVVAQSTHEKVAAVWARALKLASTNPTDEFLEIGGHSMVAIEIIAEINESMGIAVPLAALLKGGTLKEFSALVSSHIESKRKAVIEPATSPSSFAAVKLEDGLKIVAPAPADAVHLWREIFVERAYEKGNIRYPENAVIFDVGANVGLFSLFALTRISSSTVHAFEPAAESFDALMTNLSPYGPRVRLWPIGLGVHDRGNATFIYYPATPAMSSYFPDASADSELLAQLLRNSAAGRAAASSGPAPDFGQVAREGLVPDVRVAPIMRLSTAVAECGVARIDLLKIDVQRGEDGVVDGIDQSDWPKLRQVVIEMQATDGNVSRMKTRLEAKGFSVAVDQIGLHRDTNVQFLYGCRDPAHD